MIRYVMFLGLTWTCQTLIAQESFFHPLDITNTQIAQDVCALAMQHFQIDTEESLPVFLVEESYPVSTVINNPYVRGDELPPSLEKIPLQVPAAIAEELAKARGSEKLFEKSKAVYQRAYELVFAIRKGDREYRIRGTVQSTPSRRQVLDGILVTTPSAPQWVLMADSDFVINDSLLSATVRSPNVFKLDENAVQRLPGRVLAQMDKYPLRREMLRAPHGSLEQNWNRASNDDRGNQKYARQEYFEVRDLSGTEVVGYFLANAVSIEDRSKDLNGVPLNDQQLNRQRYSVLVGRHYWSTKRYTARFDAEGRRVGNWKEYAIGPTILGVDDK